LSRVEVLRATLRVPTKIRKPSAHSQRLCERHDKIYVMRIAIAQLDQVVGDLPGNAARILDAAAAGKRGDADLVVTPELSLCGYPPEDLLLRPAFLAACTDELTRIAARIAGITVLVGFPEAADG